jgi:hypothetical protein
MVTGFWCRPDSLADATRSTAPKIYAYDLVAREMVSIHASAQVAVGSPAGFFGDLLAVDWNGDNVDDAIYVGTVEGTQMAPSAG